MFAYAKISRSVVVCSITNHIKALKTSLKVYLKKYQVFAIIPHSPAFDNWKIMLHFLSKYVSKYVNLRIIPDLALYLELRCGVYFMYKGKNCFVTLAVFFKEIIVYVIYEN